MQPHCCISEGGMRAKRSDGPDLQILLGKKKKKRMAVNYTQREEKNVRAAKYSGRQRKGEREREGAIDTHTEREARGQLGQLEQAPHVKGSERLLRRVCVKQAAKMAAGDCG